METFRRICSNGTAVCQESQNQPKIANPAKFKVDSSLDALKKKDYV